MLDVLQPAVGAAAFLLHYSCAWKGPVVEEVLARRAASDLTGLTCETESWQVCGPHADWLRNKHSEESPSLGLLLHRRLRSTCKPGHRRAGAGCCRFLPSRALSGTEEQHKQKQEAWL